VNIFGVDGDLNMVHRTGQTPLIPNATLAGSDGNLQKGETWPNPRFTNNSDGTVTDNLTDLVWLQDANCLDAITDPTIPITIDKSVNGGTLNWSDALTWCNNLASGKCGLSDGSSAGDWRLPNINEILSLIHWGYQNPPISNDAGGDRWGNGTSSYINIISHLYWSSTTVPNGFNSRAFAIRLTLGQIEIPAKTELRYLWPVRDK